jgi:3-hydroxyisobutyrate dehydrogenase-like beta-hydroxyacid dehydrogenase
MKENMKNISVIGLGSMGYGIAQSLIRSLHGLWTR